MKFEAWILRDLTYIFSRAVKRGHRPREDEFLSLMKAADLPIPPPSTRSSSSLGYFEKLAYLYINLISSIQSLWLLWD